MGAPRASPVGSRIGRNERHRGKVGCGSSRRTPSGDASVNPPGSPARRCPGDPRSPAASATTVSGSSRRSGSRSARATPATQAAAEEPSPRSSGIRLMPCTATAGTGDPPPTHTLAIVGSPCRCHRRGVRRPLRPPTSRRARRRCRSPPRCTGRAPTRTNRTRAQGSPRSRGHGRGCASGYEAQFGGDRGRVRFATTGVRAPAIAHSGSLSPWPVRMHTTVAPRELAFGVEMEQARDAGGARRLGEQALPRQPPIGGQDLAVGHRAIAPSDSVAAATALSHDAGFPIRIAVAIVWGPSRARRARSAPRPGPGTPSTAAARRSRRRRGTPIAEPVARDVAGVARPARSGGRAHGRARRRSRTRPSSAPASRNGLTSSRASRGSVRPGPWPARATASKLPSTSSTRAPWTRVCAILPSATFPFGTSTAHVRPAFAA